MNNDTYIGSIAIFVLNPKVPVGKTRARLDNCEMAKVWFGTSGFSYKEWRPSFYPADLSERQFLSYYARRLNAVEIDYTFYRMPSAKTIEAWKAATPEGFRFTLKASQQITHRQRLKVPSDALEYLMGVVAGLGDRLGMILYQLPPNFRTIPSGSRCSWPFCQGGFVQRLSFGTIRGLRKRSSSCYESTTSAYVFMMLTITPRRHN